jgi:hypothetical protein
MARTVKSSDLPDQDIRSGHYKAYDRDRSLIWENPDFEHRRDLIPYGISATMFLGTLTNIKGVTSTVYTRSVVEIPVG